MPDPTACSWCDRPIAGRYLTWSDGRACCADCQRTCAPCAACRRPAVDPVEARGVTLCRACLAKVGTCRGCEAPLLTKRFVHPGLPDAAFCADCMKTLIVCDFCSAPIVAGGHRHADGRDACETCHATAVLDLAELQALEIEARGWLSDRLRFVLRGREVCPIHLVDAHQIAAVLGKAFAATPGFDGRERGLFAARSTVERTGGKITRQTDALAIYVEAGLPRAEAFGTLVHELIHLWQFDHFPKKPIHRQYLEGLAVWGQAHALTERGHVAEAARARENPHPAYGGGYKILAEIERNVGFDATAEKLVQRTGGQWRRA